MAAAVFDDENEVNSSPAFSVTISRENCKLFTKIFSYLTRFSENLCVEFRQQSILFSAVNVAKSSFFQFEAKAENFQEFVWRNFPCKNLEDSSFCVQLPAKSLYNCFKSSFIKLPSSSAQQQPTAFRDAEAGNFLASSAANSFDSATSCCLRFCPTESLFELSFLYLHGMNQKSRLNFQETIASYAIFKSPEEYACSVICSGRAFSEWLGYFAMDKWMEFNCQFHPNEIRMSTKGSTSAGESGKLRSLITTISVASNQFVKYPELGADLPVVEWAVSFHDFKNCISLAISLDSVVNIHFEKEGENSSEPILCKLNCGNFEIHQVFAICNSLTIDDGLKEVATSLFTSNYTINSQNPTQLVSASKSPVENGANSLANDAFQCGVASDSDSNDKKGDLPEDFVPSTPPRKRYSRWGANA